MARAREEYMQGPKIRNVETSEQTQILLKSMMISQGFQQKSLQEDVPGAQPVSVSDGEFPVGKD